MKILLDECVTKHLKPHLIGHEVSTVREMGWSGVKNGKLMTLCVENGFEILLTIDKNLQHQQNLDKYPLTIVILNSNTSKVQELIEFLPEFEAQLPSYQKHYAYQVRR
jgi:predicted nuclease of predicted toxin-antitoxin system